MAVKGIDTKFNNALNKIKLDLNQSSFNSGQNNVSSINTHASETSKVDLSEFTGSSNQTEIANSNTSDFSGWWDNTTSPWLKNAANNVGNVTKKAGATVATGVTSIFEGLLEFGEAVGDAGSIIATAIFTPIKLENDLLKAGLCKITNTEFESGTKKMWENRMDMVKQESFKDLFNSFYTDTGAGKWMHENAIGADTVRSVGSGVGYVGGIIALSVATFGIGGAVAGGASSGAAVSSVAGSGAVSSLEMASVAATAGFGKGTEESWNNGANLGEGLAYGSFSALWEGLQFYIGGEISKVGGVGDKIAQKLLNGEAAALKTKIAGSLTRVILDGADGGIEGFVQPLLQSIYKDESYAKLFEENGGWGNVAMQTAMGAGMSAFSEIGDMRRILKSDKNVNVTTNINDTLNLGEKFSFFSKNKDKKHFIENIFGTSNQSTSGMTKEQKEIVKQMNEFISENGGLIYTISNTAEINSTMLKNIDDLSKLQVRVIGGFRDLDNNLKVKYNNNNYMGRVTYSGYEALSIITKLEELQSKIDINLPIKERAKQIYEVLSSEIPPMRDYNQYKTGHEVSASLKGLTNNNSVGKAGLVCAGYSQAYKELCKRCGIVCDYIRGLGTTDPLAGNRPQGHAWNIVIDGNEYIPVDVTWKACFQNDNWFGHSSLFAQTHFADNDEIFKVYNLNPNEAVETMINKFGLSSTLERLNRLISTSNYNEITRDNNARDILMNTSVDKIQNIINLNNDLYLSITTMSNKYGKNGALEHIYNYMVTGDSSCITRENNCRELLSNYSLDDIKFYFEKIRRLV